jgi:hypothetical protein
MASFNEQLAKITVRIRALPRTLQNLPQTIQNLSAQEMIAYGSMALGTIFILLAVILW